MVTRSSATRRPVCPL